MNTMQRAPGSGIARKRDKTDVVVGPIPHLDSSTLSRPRKRTLISQLTANKEVSSR